MTSSNTNSNVLNPISVILLVVVGVMALVGNVGCDNTGMGGLGGYGFPSSSLYDPTGDIMSVNSYRQDVMDASNDAWDAYIRE